MSDTFTKIIVGFAAMLGVLIIVAILSIVLAFPIKWCWNYAVVSTFGLPTVTWGKAWCITFLANSLVRASSSSK